MPAADSAATLGAVDTAHEPCADARTAADRRAGADERAGRLGGILPGKLGRPSLWSVFTALVAGMVLFESAGPLSDPDVWWHIRLGRQILATHRIPHSETWSYAALGHVWRPTAWLSDVVYGGVFNTFGYSGVIALKVVVCAAFLWQLHRLLRATGLPVVPVALTFALVALTLSGFLRERPQAFSLLFVIWLAKACARVRRGQQPRAGRFLAVQWLWANTHGMWVLTPVMILLGAAGDLADSGRAGLPRLRRNALLAAGAVVVAACTPVGPGLVVQPFIVQAAAKGVSEWQHTTLWGSSLPYLIMICLLIAGSAWRRQHMPRSDAVWIVGVFVFSLMAARNVAPAAVLLAVPTAEALSRLVSLPARVRVPRAIPVGVLVVAGALVGTVVAVEAPVSAQEPTRLVREIPTLPGPHHLLNDYNVGGFITGTQPRASVAIDGRADNFPPSYVSAYLDAEDLRGDWPALIAKLAPDCAVLSKGSPLAHVLVAEYHWRTVDQQSGYVLLDRGPDGITRLPSTQP